MSRFIIGVVLGGLLGYNYGYNKAMDRDYNILDNFRGTEKEKTYQSRPDINEFLRHESSGCSIDEIVLPYER